VRNLRRCWFLLTVLLLQAPLVHAVEYYEDDRSMGSDDPSLPHYRSPEEACVQGVLIRKVQAYQEGDNRQYRYRSANVGSDDGFDEYACQGVIERRFYYPGASWVTVEVVATNVYGPFGSSETCKLGGYQDPETGQCGPPKCTDTCCDSGCGNGSNPIQTASGNKHQVETDFIGSGPFPLRFTRTYDSKRTWLNDAAPIGIGWTHSYLAHIAVMPAQGSSTLSEAVVYRPDGRILRFNLSGSTWVSDPDVSEKLNVATSGGDYVSATFTTNNDEVETYDQLGRLASIKQRGGLVQTLNYTTGPGGSSSTLSHNFVQQVTDPEGHALTFGYNGSGQLTSLTDGNGDVISYGYASGNLHTATYPDVSGTKIRTYEYNESGQTGGASLPHALTGIVDENNDRFASWGYTSAGWANLSVHGPYSTGTIDRTALAYNTDGTTTVTDGLGQARAFTFQVQYQVARYTDLDTPCDYCGSPFTSRSYDTNGYPSGGTDFRGTQTGFTYNARGLETQRDEAKTQAEERIINTIWSSSFRVATRRTVANHGGTTEKRTDWVYNTRGQPTARCEYDLTTSGASGYTCAATGTPPAGIRRWVTTYCDAVNLAAPDPIGSMGENLAKGCPLVGLVRRVDGPRTDVNDRTTYQYYLATDTGTTPAYRLGDTSAVIDALGHETDYLKYDGNGRVLRMKNMNGVITDSTWHPRGWLLTRTVRANASGSPSANDAITQMTYDGVGNLHELEQPDGVTMSYGYDNAHRLTSITDALGNHIDYTLDALGNRTAEKTFDVSNGTTPTRLVTRTFDTLSRLTHQFDAQNRDTQFAYDDNGNRTDETDPLGVKTRWTYDGLNRLATQVGDYQGTDPDTADSTTGFQYDTRDNLTQVDDPDNLPTADTFDGLDDLKQRQSPDTGTTQYPNYDAAGNRITQTDARGITWTYGYDALNRPTGVAYPTSSLDVAYLYDSYPDTPGPCAAPSYAVGRLTVMADSSGSTTFCYDLRGNVTQKIQVTSGYLFDTRYTWNLADRLMSITYPSGAKATYTRDADGRIKTVSVTPPGGSATAVLNSLTWLPFGPVKTFPFASGSQTLTKTYDQNYWMTDVTSNALNLHFCRDGMSNITDLAASSPACSATPVEQYAYDNLYRLTDVENSGGSPLQSFTYNLTGDRMSKTISPQPAQTYSYEPDTHHLDAVGTNLRQLDDNGNTVQITGAATLDFGFDDRNRLTDVHRNSSPIAVYDYNAKGERVYKSATYPASDTRWFSYAEDGTLLGEYTASSEQEYVWVDGTPVALLTISGTQLQAEGRIFANGFDPAPTITATLRYIHSDQLDTPRAVTTTAGTQVWSWSWQTNPFGEAASSGSITMNIRFPGQYADAESSTYYNGFRNYESSTGRYIESDPFGVKTSVNTYSYVSARPYLWSDHLGLAASGEVVCDGKGGFQIVNRDTACTRPCTQAHEEQHVHDYMVWAPNICRGKALGEGPALELQRLADEGWPNVPTYPLQITECRAYRAGKNCAEGLKCCPAAKGYIANAEKWLKYYKCGDYGW
jgi:RHS repeat-associated protein